jgi:hypothetical protein
MRTLAERAVVTFVSISLLSGAVCASGQCPSAQQEPFEIVNSFPVSEPTWGAKWKDLYLVAAQRSVLVFERTGPAPSDYRQVGMIYPGHDTDIKNGHIEDGLLYIGAKAEGLLAYDLHQVTCPDPQPLKRFRPPGGHFVGWIEVNEDRIYAAYWGGGLAVVDKKTFRLLGEGLKDYDFAAFTATRDGHLYAKEQTRHTELTILDVRDPNDLKLVRRMQNEAYPTVFRMPPAVIGNTLYTAELNGGVGVYDISEPATPVLKGRAYEVGGGLGERPGRLNTVRQGSIRFLATDGKRAFVNYELTVDSLDLRSDGMPKLATVSISEENLRTPAALVLHEDVLAIPTTVEGIRFIDVSDPADPKLLLLIALPSRLEAMAKVGRMLYVTGDVDGVWQLDWEAEGAPRAIRRIHLGGLSEDLVLYRDHLYVADGHGVGTINVSDESNPHVTDYWRFPYVGKPEVAKGWVEGVDILDGVLYVALGPAGLGVFDLTTPSRPKHITTFDLHSDPLVKAFGGQRLFGHDVSPHPVEKVISYGGTSALVMIDVSDPSAPRVVSLSPVDSELSCGDFSPDGNHVAANLKNGLAIFDTRDLTRPQLLLKNHEGGGSECSLFYKDYLLTSGRGRGVTVFRMGKTPADLTLVQRIPSYFFNSKFLVDGDRIFVNGQGVHELRVR